MKLLHIDSSILGTNSVSRILSAEIVDQLRAQRPELDVIYRDLANDALLHLAPAHIAAWQGVVSDDAAAQKDITSSEEVLNELFTVDVIVVGVPMYNFTIPSQLKAWVDRILIPGRTFRYTESGAPIILLPKGKKVIIAASCGGFYDSSSPFAFMDQQVSYLTNLFGFLEITDVTVIRAQGVAVSPTQRAAALVAAREKIAALAL